MSENEKRYFADTRQGREGVVYRLRSIDENGIYNLRDVDTGHPASFGSATVQGGLVEVGAPARQGKSEAELDRLDAEREAMESDIRIAKGATVWVADYDVLSDEGLLCVRGVLQGAIIGDYGVAGVRYCGGTLIVSPKNVFLTEEEAEAAGRVLVETKLVHLKAEYEKEVAKYAALLQGGG